jgi:hypothetical protein
MEGFLALFDVALPHSIKRPIILFTELDIRLFLERLLSICQARQEP